jgi:hypothetical protein
VCRLHGGEALQVDTLLVGLTASAQYQCDDHGIEDGHRRYRQMGHELHGGGGHGRGSHRDKVAQVATGAGPHKKGDGQAVEDGPGRGRDREQQGNGAGDGGGSRRWYRGHPR